MEGETSSLGRTVPSAAPVKVRRRRKAQPNVIGTLNEGSVHDALKRRYAAGGDGAAMLEVPVDGYVADVVRGGRLFEVQTSGFSRLKRKLPTLLENHRVTLVHPIAEVRHIVKLPEHQDGETTRRRSPRRGAVTDVFAELVYVPTLLEHPNLTLDVVLIEEDEIRAFDGRRGRRRNGWVVVGRRLVDVRKTVSVGAMADLFALLAPNLPERFTTADLAAVLRRPRRLAQQAAYCLHACDLVEIVGKEGNAIVYARA